MNPPDDPKTDFIYSDVEVEDIIEEVLRNDDMDQDGYIDYAEFTLAQKRGRTAPQQHDGQSNDLPEVGGPPSGPPSSASGIPTERQPPGSPSNSDALEHAGDIVHREEEAEILWSGHPSEVHQHQQPNQPIELEEHDLHQQPNQPIEHFRQDTPQQPIEHSHQQPNQPIEHLHQQQNQPIEHFLQDNPQQPNEHLHQDTPQQPIENMRQRPNQPIEHFRQDAPQQPIDNLHQHREDFFSQQHEEHLRIVEEHRKLQGQFFQQPKHDHQQQEPHHHHQDQH